MTPPIVSWGVIGLFAVAVCLLGGSSRPDAVQIVALRPLCALLLIPALYLLTFDQMVRVRAPLVFLALLTFWMLLQLIPLPPAIWHSLPDREALVQLDAIALDGEVWRPISLVPTRGINALAAMIVPTAAAIIVIALRLRSRDLLIAVAAVGVANAVLGFVQSLAGAQSDLFFYAITNNSAVGLFANENHSSVFSAISLLAAARLALDTRWVADNAWLRNFGILAFVTNLLAFITSGSRAGIVAGFMALACFVAMFYLVASTPNRKTARRSNASIEFEPPKVKRNPLNFVIANPLRLGSIGLIALFVLLAVFVVNGRAAGLEDIMQSDPVEDLRFRLLPVLQSMMATHWLFGAGFGSFEEVYHIYEPTDLLFAFYLNQAHNDGAQYVIEGGLPALLVLLGALVWVARRLVSYMRGADRNASKAVYWGGTFFIIMVASISDYPLRTPLFQAMAVWLIIALALDTSDQSKSTKRRSLGEK